MADPAAGRYHVEFARSARREMGRLSERVVHAILAFADGPLADNPHKVGKPLRGDLEGVHSARRGSFRILYEIYDEEVLVIVVRVSPRAEAYRPR